MYKNAVHVYISFFNIRVCLSVCLSLYLVSVPLVVRLYLPLCLSVCWPLCFSLLLHSSLYNRLSDYRDVSAGVSSAGAGGEATREPYPIAELLGLLASFTFAQSSTQGLQRCLRSWTAFVAQATVEEGEGSAGAYIRSKITHTPLG